ncbi:putative pectinesterase/pectinesterase inhibitor 40 [Acorus gramineus]|uniref:Pectinesterase n=1 Tax=Acorus gramineus TaxID=55184 RepID=A0AAV9BS34_ACOGR|nr:putative pectinesterase/pectinesterase inhibitor 40 [Acorus gramineus]
MSPIRRRTKFIFSVIPISTLLFLYLLTSTTKAISVQTVHLQNLHHHHQLCEGTTYTDLCFSTLTSHPNLTSKPLPQIISSVVRTTIAAVDNSASNCTTLRHTLRRLDPRSKMALDDCLELLEEAAEDLSAALGDLKARAEAADDLQTLLSAAMTNAYTCLDGFYNCNDTEVWSAIDGGLKHVHELISTSLAMVQKMKVPPPAAASEGEAAFEEYGRVHMGFPGWVSRKDRKVLLEAAKGTVRADLVVAKDGTGNFTKVAEAVAAVPDNRRRRFVIYIKEGTYFENVEVNKTKTNVMFVGDGIGKTVIKANRNAVDGWTTFRSATVAVVGNGFLARDLTIENYAGPSKQQAVALRVGSDRSAFYMCAIVGYQDTLYVHSLRQFYRQCNVFGTVDFIFGDASVVFQDCNLFARRPNPKQHNIFTAQGRADKNQNSGISIQNCRVTASSDLVPVKSRFKTYLGRPWKEYSRTMYMQSRIDDLVDPAGWVKWEGDFALKTLYYREYMNLGAGADTSKRVTWPGFRVTRNETEAAQFTVREFIQGEEWLNETSIPYRGGLS